MGGQEFAENLVLFPGRARRTDGKPKIGPGETGDERFRLPQAKQFDDVAPDGCRGRGRQSDGRRTSHRAAKLPEPSVVGPKIVPPFADAMGFVHRQQPHSDATHRLDKTGAAKPLGHDVNQPVIARRHLFEPLGLLVGRKRAVDERRWQAERRELIDLIFHQRNQRGNDQSDPRLDDGRQLVAKAFASAGRHDAKTVVAGQDRFNHLALSRPKGRQTERGRDSFPVRFALPRP